MQKTDCLTAMSMEQSHCCAVCYGHLVTRYLGNNQAAIQCENPNCTGQGFVTRAWAERRKAEQVSEYFEVRVNYPHLSSRPKRSEQELINSLIS
jgi:hypothetical protein